MGPGIPLGPVLPEVSRLHDYLSMRMVPEPKRGGTFFYCPWTERAPGHVSVCGEGNRKRTGARFRTLAKYRRHWRRAHA